MEKVKQMSDTTAHVDSASDARTANNTVRHTYRVLSDAEKASMVAIKDKGAELLNLIEGMRSHITYPDCADVSQSIDGGVAPWDADRELKIAYERVEEAVMWAVKHITR